MAALLCNLIWATPNRHGVSEILEHQGRQKARFISTAILHYINCKETPEVTLPRFQMQRR